jgi:hypothetical protein
MQPVNEKSQSNKGPTTFQGKKERKNVMNQESDDSTAKKYTATESSKMTQRKVRNTPKLQPLLQWGPGTRSHNYKVSQSAIMKKDWQC